MRIKYYILWIENEKDWYDTTKDFVTDVLEENQFELVTEVYSSENEISELIKNEAFLQKFDLILVDFQLDKGDRGSNIIENIRSHRVFTEIIFYSQDLPSIRTFLADNFIDGVYIANRDGGEFREKFEKVFLSTVKKTQSISAVRGLVISETSILDDKVYNIIVEFFSKFPEEQKEKIRTYIFEDLIGDLEEKGRNQQEYLTTLPNETLILNSYFDAYKKARVLGRIIQLLNNNELLSKKEFNTKYVEEIINVRNELAHCIEQDGEEGSCLVTKKGGKTYNDAECKLVRRNIRAHFKHLEDIENHIAVLEFK